MTDYINHISHQIKSGLPGRSAHVKMAPSTRKERHYAIPEQHEKAAVMLLLYPKSKEWYISFIRRATRAPRDKHSGQISFPGGRFEVEDNHLEHCALRETEEEIGVNAEDVRIIGALSELYVPVSNFLVYPFVGYVDYTPKFTKQDSEVDEVLEFPLSYLQQKQIRKTTDLHVRGYSIKNVPYFDLDNQILWGATAMMLNEFLEL